MTYSASVFRVLSVQCYVCVCVLREGVQRAQLLDPLKVEPEMPVTFFQLSCFLKWKLRSRVRL